MRVGITGSHGLIGTALVARLEQEGHEVRRIVRTGHLEAKAEGSAWFSPGYRQACLWGIEGFDALVHLAGEPIGSKRWNPKVKGEIYASRVYGTEAIMQGLNDMPHPPRTVIVASAIGLYGDRGEEVLREGSSPGEGFLAHVVTDWEAAAQTGADAVETLTMVRTGLVLARHGGLLARLLRLYQLGLGGPLGSGAQFMSVISLQDEVAALMSLLSDPVAGPVNLVGPFSLTNAEWSASLAHYLRRPHFLAVPTLAVEVALGKEMAEETALISQRVEPAVLASRDFHFGAETLEQLWGVVLG